MLYTVTFVDVFCSQVIIVTLNLVYNPLCFKGVILKTHKTITLLIMMPSGHTSTNTYRDYRMNTSLPKKNK